MRKDIFSIAALMALCVSVDSSFAQKTHVVDTTGNGDFLSIDSAVQFASSGDRIFVQAGVYAPFVVNKKVLRIVGTDGAVVRGNVVIRDVGPSGTFVLSKMRIDGDLTFAKCSARIVLAEVGADEIKPWVLRVEDCSAFNFSDLRTTGPTTIVRSHGSIVASSLQKIGLSLLGRRLPALTIEDSDLVLAGVETRSAATVAAGILMKNSSLEILDDGASQISGGPPILGSGTVLVDSQTYFGGLEVKDAIRGPTWSQRPLAHIGAGSSAIGDEMLVLMAKEQSQAWALMLGLPGPRIKVAGIRGRFELSSIAGVISGGPGKTVEAVRFRVPNELALVGFHLGWQALTVDQDLALTNLSTNVVLR